MKKRIGIGFISISILLFIMALYMNSAYKNVSRPFSSYTLLSSSWEKYKGEFVGKDGRVMDHSQHDITTSEGQSYALLRAVWIDDKPTFDTVWQFTKNNLQHKTDALFGWRWGKRSDNTYGFMQDGGENSASDADTDIALALLLASHRWHVPIYEKQALPIIQDLFLYSTTVINGKRYLLAGNWANEQTEAIINPSYFAPYAWRIFAIVDKKNNWQSLITPAYDLLTKVGDASLDKTKGVGLPPDWVALDKSSGIVHAAAIQNFTTNYAFDAIRVPWRIALDYQWNNDPQAYQYLSREFSFLGNAYMHDGRLVSMYSHDGEQLSGVENPVMYATFIGYLTTVKPDFAKKLYEEKITKLYSNEENTFKQVLPYYEQNWLWFGAALYNKTLINFAKNS